MRRFALARKWLLVSAGVALMAIAGVAAAVAVAADSPRPAARLPAARVRSVLPSVQAHYPPDSYISAATARRAALAVASAMGPGAQVLQARLMSAAAASKATGDRVASNGAGGSGEVWLVWLRGPFRVITSCLTATACPVRLNQIFYVTIDARTGADPEVGWKRAYQSYRSRLRVAGQARRPVG